jgi:HAD superfamily hydrolase (TIGR01450 family)
MVEVVAGRAPLGNIATVVFDLDGVVYVDGAGIPGAGEALQQLEDAGRRVLFATNNATKTRRAAADQIATATGYSCRPDQVVTSSFVTARSISGRYRAAFVVGESGLVETLNDEGVNTVDDRREADVVVVGLDRYLSYDKLADAALAISVGGAAFVATNTDTTYPTAAGPAPGGGAIVAAIATATGIAPQVFGKPQPAYRSVVKDLAVGSVLMVGDRPETDLAMGRAEGWQTVLVLTGVVTDPKQVDPSLAPDHVLESIAALPGLLGL